MWRHVGLAWQGREKATSGMSDTDRSMSKEKHEHQRMHDERRKEKKSTVHRLLGKIPGHQLT